MQKHLAKKKALASKVHAPGSLTATSSSPASTSAAATSTADDTDEDEDEDDDSVNSDDDCGARCGATCNCERMTRTDLRKNALDRRQHMNFVYMGKNLRKLAASEKKTIPFPERVIKAVRDAMAGPKELLLEIRKEMKTRGEQMDEVESAAKVSTLLAKSLPQTPKKPLFQKAVTEKEIREELAEDAKTLVLPWKTMDDAYYFMEDRERKAMVMRAIKNDVGGQKVTFVKKCLDYFFDGRLLGRIYRNNPRK